jgi:hypothetical protein
LLYVFINRRGVRTGGLLPISASKSELGRLANIRDRMKQHGVPGLSVAVIADGRIA